MPCRDVTETVRLTLDGEDRLLDYALAKRTCRRGVGTQDLLLQRVRGLSARELLALDADALFGAGGPATDLEEFLALKHLFAIQEALSVLSGDRPGGTGDRCTIGEVSSSGGEIEVRAEISLDLLTEKIRSCGRCKGCGSAGADGKASAATA